MSTKYRKIKDQAIENIDENRRLSEAWVFWDRYMKVIFVGDIEQLSKPDRARLRVDIGFKMESIRRNLAEYTAAANADAINKANHSLQKCLTMIAEIAIVENEPLPVEVSPSAYPRLRLIALESEALLSILEREMPEQYQSLRERAAAKAQEQLQALK